MRNIDSEKGEIDFLNAVEVNRKDWARVLKCDAWVFNIWYKLMKFNLQNITVHAYGFNMSQFFLAWGVMK